MSKEEKREGKVDEEAVPLDGTVFDAIQFGNQHKYNKAAWQVTVVKNSWTLSQVVKYLLSSQAVNLLLSMNVGLLSF